MNELIVVVSILALTFFIYIVSTVLLCAWLGRKIAHYRVYKSLDINGPLDWLCIICTFFNFYLVVPCGIIYSLFITQKANALSKYSGENKYSNLT